MKKLFLGCWIILCSAFTVAAYETVEIIGDNYSYLFNIYQKGENTDVEDEGKLMIGFFDILNNYKLPIFTSGKKWASVVGSVASDPVSYMIVAENDYNAAAYSRRYRDD